MVLRRLLSQYAFVLPGVGFLALLFIIPILYTVWLSFYSWSLIRPELGTSFAWFDNYVQLLTDARVATALWNTLKFTVGSVAIEFFVGLLVALALNRDLPGFGIFKTLILIPFMMAPVVVGFTWRIMLDPSVGPTPLILQFLGILEEGARPILSTARLSLPAVILVDAWQFTPFVILVLLAGLQSLPVEPYEAAAVDGANAWQTFRAITLPGLRPAILVVLLLRTIGAIRTFDLIFIMTGGGPGTSSEVLAMLNYRIAFDTYDMGYGATLSLLILAISMIISFIYIRSIRIETVR